MWWPSNVGSMGLPDNVAKTRMCVCVCVCVCMCVCMCVWVCLRDIKLPIVPLHTHNIRPPHVIRSPGQ